LSFSDDHASQAAPFFGDETGEIFDAPDVVFESPTTTERVVDTQSGFLVVIKRVDSRLALSVKRRLGTPPVSSILLTPDESLKLSKILAGPQATNGSGKLKGADISPAVAQWLDSVEDPQGRTQERRHGDRRKSDLAAKAREEENFKERTRKEEEELKEVDLDRAAQNEQENKTDTAKGAWERFTASPKNPVSLNSALLICLIGGAVTVGMVFSSFLLPREQHKPEVKAPSVLDLAQAKREKVEQFAGNFLVEMLDFNPSTYRYSQVQAMSAMTPELLNRYWKETHFPIPINQLHAAAPDKKLAVNKVEQTIDSDASKRDVDIFASLPGKDSASPVHVRLKVLETPQGDFKISDLQDVTDSK
jgi:hypothetical protein